MSIFWPFVAPIFIGRYVVVILGLIGIASAFQVGRELHSPQAGLLSMTLWILQPQMMFLERMALVDTTISAMAMLTLWIAIRMIRTGRFRTALLCGVGLALCVLAKTTGIVFFPIPLLAAIFIRSRTSLTKRAMLVFIAWITAVVILLPVAMYVLTTGEDPTAQKYGLTSTNPEKMSVQIPRNLSRIANAESIYFSAPMLIVLAVVILIALVRRPRAALILLALAFGLLAAITVVGARVWLRYMAPATPFILMSAAIGLLEAVMIMQRFRIPAASFMPWTIAAAWGLLFCLPFHFTAYTDPKQLDMPSGDYTEYISGIASGYGIDQAVPYLLNKIKTPTTVVVTAANCDGARMYVPYGSPVTLFCPGIDWAGYTDINREIVRNIAQRVKQEGPIYIIGENVAIIPEYQLPRPYRRLIEFPRPESHGWYGVRVYHIEGVTPLAGDPDAGN
jgi:4-amino-4-deoxy-L-arabinose transferase-like glycosyltransferase